MSIYDVRNFFMWCTIINAGLLILSFLVIWIFGKNICGKYSKLFDITEGQFNAAMFTFVGMFKIQWLVFNLVPFAALSVITS